MSPLHPGNVCLPGTRETDTRCKSLGDKDERHVSSVPVSPAPPNISSSVAGSHNLEGVGGGCSSITCPTPSK